jgi:uncharacterized protein YdeI (YjbR/CyaY-like superfamily)
VPARKPAAKPVTRNFQAPLEHLNNNLGWVIARIPFAISKAWGARGQIRVKGEINGFALGTTLFPDGNGGHFLLVNKKMQFGGKTRPGLTAKFCLTPDLAPAKTIETPQELLDELSQSKRLLKFYESFSKSIRKYLAEWVAQGKQKETRVRRAQQLAERIMETLEAERELPPMIAMALRQNPLAREKWESLPASHRRRHLFSIFYYRDPAARARRLAKAIEEMLGQKPESTNEEDCG